jgi:hypothetical protein
MKKINHKSVVFLLVCLFGLMGCGSVSSSVSRFHKISNLPKGRYFIVLPILKNKKGSLEFEEYAKNISSRLEKFGMIYTSRKQDADYAILLDYGIGGGKTSTSSMPLYGRTGGGTTYHSGTVSSSSGGYGNYSGTSYAPSRRRVIGSIPITRTIYTRLFVMDIIDLKKSSPGNIVKVFEGKVNSVGSSNSFHKVSNCLISAMFENFPGKSGSTIDVSGSSCVQ